MRKTRLYNTLIKQLSHTQIQHESHTTILYNTLIHQANVAKMLIPTDTRFSLSFLKAQIIKLKIQFHTRQKIQHAYNIFLQHAYNKTFIQHKKYNIRWTFLSGFIVIAVFPC